MNRSHWFLPETPDLIAALREQNQATLDGVEALARWARGDVASAETVREAEHRGDECKRRVVVELRAAFVTPLEPEDVFALSRGIDWILNYARDLVNEAEAMRCAPDQGLAEMTERVGEAVGQIDEALGHMKDSSDRAVEAADAALKTARTLQRSYFDVMARLLDEDDAPRQAALRELYRRCSRIGEAVVDVAERIVYSVMKES